MRDVAVLVRPRREDAPADDGPVRCVVYLPVANSQEALTVLKEFETEIGDFEFRHGTMDDVLLTITRRGTDA